MEDTQGLVRMFLEWFPILAFIVTLIWLVRRNNRNMTSKSGKGYVVLMEELIEEMRRQNDLVECMVKDQGERIKKLEEK